MYGLSYEVIDDLAEKILINYYGTERFPLKAFDIDAFAKDYMKLNIRYERLTFGKEAQLALTVNAGQTVRLCEGDPSHDIYVEDHTILLDHYLAHPSKIGQRNFSIAHECGHHAIASLTPEDATSHTKNNDVRFMSPKQRFWFEWQANSFASALLMPRYLIECMQLIMGHPDKFVIYEGDRLLYDERKELHRLAGMLNVSPSALLYRLKKLSLVEVYTEMEYLDDAYQEYLKEGSPYGSFFRPRPSVLRSGQKRARPAQTGILVI